MNRSLTCTTATLRTTSAIAMAATILVSGVAHAQDHHGHRGHRATGPAYYGWYPYHGTTWQESVLHGYSDLLRSAGQRELLHYEALRSREAAIEHSLENSVRRLEVRQTRQLMGLQHRETVRRMERDRRATAAATDAAPVGAAPLDDAAEAERRAAAKLHLARGLLDAGHSAGAGRYLEDILRDYAGTAAAEEAEQLLAEL